MEYFSEIRTPAQVLNFALSCQRCQEKQSEILRSCALNWNNQKRVYLNNCLETIKKPSNTQHKQT